MDKILFEFLLMVDVSPKPVGDTTNTQAKIDKIDKVKEVKNLFFKVYFRF